MSASSLLEDTPVISDVSTLEKGNDAALSPPLSSDAHTLENDVSMAYVGEIDETTVVKQRVIPNDEMSAEFSLGNPVGAQELDSIPLDSNSDPKEYPDPDDCGDFVHDAVVSNELAVARLEVVSDLSLENEAYVERSLETQVVIPRTDVILEDDNIQKDIQTIEHMATESILSEDSKAPLAFDNGCVPNETSLGNSITQLLKKVSLKEETKPATLVKLREVDIVQSPTTGEIVNDKAVSHSHEKREKQKVSHRETVLPRVAMLYKTMTPATEKSRMASRGEIPFIFRPNGSHVYITSYKDDNRSMSGVKTPNSKSVSARISALAVPQHKYTIKESPEIRRDSHREQICSTQPTDASQAIDDATLDMLLDGGEKVVSDTSPTDVRKIDSVEPFNIMTPKNLDAALF